MDIDVNAPEFKQAVAAAVEKETGGLKEKNKELLDELKPLKEKMEKFKDFDPAEYSRLKALERDGKDKEIKDPVELRNRIEAEFAPKLTAAEKRAEEAETKLKQRTIDGELTSALIDSGVSKEFLPAAKALITSGRKVDVTDGGAIVDGKPVSAFAKDFAASDEGKHFVSAPNSQGGGAKGGAGGDPAKGKQLSEMSNADKAAFIREHGPQAWADKVATEMKDK